MNNADLLLEKGDHELRRDMLSILEVAIESVDPYRCVDDVIEVQGDVLGINSMEFYLKDKERIIVVGGGKASYKMVAALNDNIGERISEGVVNSPTEGEVGAIKLHKATHPDPTEGNVSGAKEIMSLCQNAGENDLVICLISGGGSAMIPCPVEGVTVEEKRKTAEALMLAGANIEELNTVRRHLSRLKGGNLAKIVYPAQIVSLILSDVVGNPLESIASGLTAPDPTTFSDALSVLMEYDLGSRVPRSVVNHLAHGKEENPKPGDPIFENVENIIVGDNRKALTAAHQEAGALGYSSVILTNFLEGEAKEVGKVLAAIGNEMVLHSSPLEPPAIILAGGETTVTVEGSGIGGRNTELVLASLLKLEEGVTVLSFGTDGLDGKSEAGGAIADVGSRAPDFQEFLENNDSASFFKREGGLIFTGETGTNVGDIMMLGARRKQ